MPAPRVMNTSLWILAQNCENGKQLKKESIDIVLTDLMLPEIDGLEFMRIVKTDQPSLPVVMITGYATINTALQATHLGAFDYIANPFTKAELVSVVNRAAELVAGTTAEGEENGSGPIAASTLKDLKGVGEHSWLMKQKGDIVLLGVERSFLHSIGRIQNLFLPNPGDMLRQGSEYLQIFSGDLNCYKVPAPLSGTVIEVNEKALANPEVVRSDPYGEGWLIKLQPARFEEEIKELGL